QGLGLDLEPDGTDLPTRTWADMARPGTPDRDVALSIGAVVPWPARRTERTMIATLWTHARQLFDEIKGVVLACGLVLVAQTAIGQPFMVPSGSMEPTLLIGDEIAAAKYAYGYGRYSAPIGTLPMNGRVFDRAPERGDIAVFALPHDPKTTFVKRVIGLPGDRIQMRRGSLFISGVEVPRRRVGRVTTSDGERAIKYVETLPNGRSHDIIV